MKGIILAGGKGTRLLPATRITNKHLIPILNQPMVTYPLETLKKIGITDIMIVSGGEHIGGFAEFFGSGKEYGVNLTYRVQDEAGGIAQALGLAEDFAAGDDVAVILGDNIFDNSGLSAPPLKDGQKMRAAELYLSHMPSEEATRFGVLLLKEKDGKHSNIIVEKPSVVELDKEEPDEQGLYPVVTGLYMYPNEVFSVIKTLKPSSRGELEITDVNNHFVKEGRFIGLRHYGFWSDAGTPESLARATQWVLDKKSKSV